MMVNIPFFQEEFSSVVVKGKVGYFSILGG